MATVDPEKAQKAAAAIAALAAKMKPSKRNGATSIIRTLRDELVSHQTAKATTAT